MLHEWHEDSSQALDPLRGLLRLLAELPSLWFSTGVSAVMSGLAGQQTWGPGELVLLPSGCVQEPYCCWADWERFTLFRAGS